MVKKIRFSYGLSIQSNSGKENAVLLKWHGVIQKQSNEAEFWGVAVSISRASVGEAAGREQSLCKKKKKPQELLSPNLWLKIIAKLNVRRAADKLPEMAFLQNSELFFFFLNSFYFLMEDLENFLLF